MRRAILMAAATMSLLGASAMADDFTFSFTDPTIGSVTGEIFGLQNDGQYHSATEVLITSAPASFGSFDPIATDWSIQDTNSFQETDGVITDWDFFAYSSTVSGYPDFDIFVPYSFFATDDDSILVPGPGTITFAPVPEPFAWFLLLTAMFAVAFVKRSRRTPPIR